MNDVTLVRAGAGSGKTYTIETRLGEWLKTGEVAPDRIIAVTFTEAAAAELRERIRGQLLRQGRTEDALRLQDASISTIHGFGLRLLKEYAFEAGTSPVPRLLTNEEGDVLIRQSLARTDRSEPVTSRLGRFGYRYTGPSGDTPEQQFRGHLRSVLDRLRNLAHRSADPAIAERGCAWISQRYGPTTDGASLQQDLEARIRELLQQFPESLESHTPGNASATDALRQDFLNLRRALEPGALDDDFRLWRKLQSLRKSKRGHPLPEPYDQLAEQVEQAAGALRTHDGPLHAAHQHLHALVGSAQDALEHYTRQKREAGLVDYTDMVAMAFQLLAERPDLVDRIRSRYDCLIIDEFQDTSVLQFAFLWTIARSGIRTLIVGDAKQSIMSFQGADPRLISALAADCPCVETLGANYRSRPPIMDFVNRLGAGLFPGEYEPLEPKAAPPTLPDPVEILLFDQKVPQKVNDELCQAINVARRVVALLDDPEAQVLDRTTRQLRPLAGSDIAVLCPTHALLSVYAHALRAHGLRVRLPQPGWFGSRIVRIADQALAYLANPHDRHAALYLATSDVGSVSLREGLLGLVRSGRIEDPILEAIDILRLELPPDTTVDYALARLVGALRLHEVIHHWPDADQARSNLVRLEGEAFEYRKQPREALAASGIYGEGIQSFRAWLKARTLNEPALDRQPDARFADQQAVDLTTWHSAKGREWPVVAVCGLGYRNAHTTPRFDIGFDAFDDLSGLIDRARFEFSPSLDDPQAAERFVEPIVQAQSEEARRLIYVAITRARDKLLIAWPAYKEAHKGNSLWRIFREATGLAAHPTAGVFISGEPYPARVLQAEVTGELPCTGTAPAPAPFGRRALDPRETPAGLSPDSISPTALGQIEAPAPQAVRVHAYGHPLSASMFPPSPDMGSRLHSAYEAIGPRLHRPGEAQRIATRLFSHQAGTVISAVDTFELWVRENFPGARIRRELPVSALNERSSVVNGIIDLLIELPHGLWVIDHKSDLVDNAASGYRQYRRQLLSYEETLVRAGYRVLGLGVHWIRRAAVVLEART